MKLLWVFLAVVYTFTRRPAHTLLCNQCSGQDGFACLSPTIVSICNGTMASAIQFTCPDNEYCFANLAFPCARLGIDPYTCWASCTGECIISGNHVCTGPNTYKVCSQNEYEGMCPPGQICTGASACESSVGKIPQCEKPIVYPSPTPDDLCAGELDGTKIPLSPPDPFCRKYIQCRYRNGALRGTIYNCPGRNQFDFYTGTCQRNQVSGCRTS